MSESETRARFRVGKDNLGERRGEVGGLGVVRRWTAICSNEIGEYTRMIPKKLHTIQVKIRKSKMNAFPTIATNNVYKARQCIFVYILTTRNTLPEPILYISDRERKKRKELTSISSTVH